MFMHFHLHFLMCVCMKKRAHIASASPRTFFVQLEIHVFADRALQMIAVTGADMEKHNAGTSQTIARLERELSESAARLADRCPCAMIHYLLHTRKVFFADTRGFPLLRMGEV